MAIKHKCDICAVESDWSRKNYTPSMWKTVNFMRRMFTLCEDCAKKLEVDHMSHDDTTEDKFLSHLQDLVAQYVEDSG